MKFVILAATIGHVFGAQGDACRTWTTAADPAVAVEWRGLCDADTNEPDGSGVTSNDDGANTSCATGTASATDNTAAQVCGGGAADASVDQGAAGGLCYAEVRAAVAVGGTTQAVEAAPCAGTDGDVCLGEDTAAKTDGVCNGAPIADAAACDPTATAPASLCTSGTCTETDSSAPTVGTCAATPAAAGTDGADCKPAVAACDANLTVDDGADTAVTTDDFCKGTQTALVSGNAAGADGGAPRTVVAGDDRCDGALVATITTGTDASCKCGAAETDDSPAAIFYGMSMVTAAVAYLL